MGFKENLGIWTFVFLFGLLVYYIVKVLVRQQKIEGFIADANQQNVYLMDNIFDSDETLYRDINLFLERDIVAGNRAVNNLVELDNFFTDYDYLDCDTTPKRVTCDLKHDMPKGVVAEPMKWYTRDQLKQHEICIPPNHPIRKILLKYQPEPMKGSDPVIDWFGMPYYRDKRFPLDMIKIQFAANPTGFTYSPENIVTYPTYEVKKDINAPVYEVVPDTVKQQGVYPLGEKINIIRPNNKDNATILQAPLTNA